MRYSKYYPAFLCIAIMLASSACHSTSNTEQSKSNSEQTKPDTEQNQTNPKKNNNNYCEEYCINRCNTELYPGDDELNRNARKGCAAACRSHCSPKPPSPDLEKRKADPEFKKQCEDKCTARCKKGFPDDKNGSKLSAQYTCIQSCIHRCLKNPE